MRGRSQNFHFQGVLPYEVGGGDFLGGGSCPSAYYGPGQSTGGDQVAKFPEASRI